MDKKVNSPGILGIDAGGTFTDLVFWVGNDKDERVKARVKTPTKHDELIQTIETGIDTVLAEVEVSAIKSVNLATTLATNAIVENRLRSTALILIGYNAGIVKDGTKNSTFGTENVYSVRGGHDIYGCEKSEFDEAGFKEIIRSLPANVEAVAVSGYFSVRNTAHENRAAELINELRPALYVSCGHELSTELDAVRRATTTVLNAGLIPIVMELLNSVEKTCGMRNINVPISVVRGDGSIVSAEWAKSHPVEMILSGPAASACGARALASSKADLRGTWIVDIGGTTTDIIRLDENGNSVLTDDGAEVAGHRTLVKAIDIYTFGLGGDTRVLCGEDGELSLSSRRVEALCRLAEIYPHVTDELKMLKKHGYTGEPLFVMKGENAQKREPESNFEKNIMQRIASEPHAREILLYDERFIWLKYRQLENMEAKGLVRFASFTPTDALNVLGAADVWNSEASYCGAELLVSQILGRETAEKAAECVREMAVASMSLELMKKNLEEKGFELQNGGEALSLIREALRYNSQLSGHIGLYLNAMLIGAGAPSASFVPLAGNMLHEKAVLPTNCDVAGAVGAAAGTFLLTYSVRINPIKDERIVFRVHYPLGIKDFDELEAAAAFACEFMLTWLEERARSAGAVSPDIRLERHDETEKAAGRAEEVYLYTQLDFEVRDAAERE